MEYYIPYTWYIIYPILGKSNVFTTFQKNGYRKKSKVFFDISFI